MERLEVRTRVSAPPGEVFDLLADFPGYAQYSQYLESVESDGDGTIGMTYTLHFAWWRVEYSVRSIVTGIDRPDRIEFELIEGIDADGEWQIRPGEEPGATSEIRFLVRYDPESIGGDAISLPTLVPVSSVIDRAEPYLVAEAERVLKRVVADLEGEHRSVEVDLRTT